MPKRPSNSAVRALLVLLLLWVPVAQARAQLASSTLTGTVTDETGAALPDVKVVIRNVASNAERRVSTDRNGSFAAAFLPPGRYVVTAHRDGFAPSELRDLTLNINDQLTIAIELKVKAATESVTVTAERSRISLSPSVGTVVDRQFVANAPLNGRSLHALLQLVPGVVITGNLGGSATSGAQFSVNGQRTTANSFYVDGVSANAGVQAGAAVAFQSSAGTGQTAAATTLGGTNSLASLDAVQEFRIETSTFAPEFGRSPGGQVSLVTRSGSSELHGSAATYFRHEVLDANDWFANRASQPKAKERQVLFSGTLGGPLLPNRLFFFGSYEGLRLKQPKTLVAGVLTEDLRAQTAPAVRPYMEAFPLPNGRVLRPGVAEFVASYSDPGSFDVSALRLDYHANRISGFLRVNHAPSDTTTRQLSQLTRVDATSDTATAGATWVMSETTTADVRVNWTWNHVSVSSSLDDFGGAVVPSVSEIFLPGRDPSTSQVVFRSPSAGLTWGAGSDTTQRQVNLVGTWAWLAKAHQIKLGVDYRRLNPRLSSGGFLLEATYFGAVQQVVNSQTSFHTITNADPIPREPLFSQLSLYAQDFWRVSSRLTTTYGLRFEYVPQPSEAANRLPPTVLGVEGATIANPRLAPAGTPMWHGRLTRVAPRLGASYQLGTHPGWETIVRGGAGVFGDVDLGDFSNGFALYPFFAQVSQTAPLAFPLSASVRTPPTLGVDAPTQLWMLDPNLTMPYTIQWNASIEQALGDVQTATVTYVGAEGRRLLVNQSYRAPLEQWPTRPTLLYVERNRGRSRYNAWQFKYERRLHNGVSVLSSYTLGTSNDNGSRAGFLSPTSIAGEWGPSDFDVRHVFSAAVMFDLPAINGPRFVNAMTRSWGLDMLLRAQSAPPVSPFVAFLPSETGGSLDVRPDIVAGVPLYLSGPQYPGGRSFNPAAFVAPAPLTQGTFPRNGLRGYKASQLDLSLRREMNIGQGIKIQFKAELFNALNHPNFGQPAQYMWDPQFGQSTQMLNRSLGGLNSLYQMGGPRSGELAVKLLF